MIKPADLSLDTLWPSLQREADATARREPLLAVMLDEVILKASDFGDALARLLARKLAGDVPANSLYNLLAECLAADAEISRSAQKDILATLERDPAATSPLAPFLFFKGYRSLQTYRMAHQLWGAGRCDLALFLQSRASELFSVDIHPAARIGHGVMLDHATGIVIGETAVVGNDVSILHNVTLGGTGNETGDRHPKIGSDVMIGAGAKILGNITVGDGARIAAGSVVLHPVEAHMTVAGIPARVVGKAGCDRPAAVMDQTLPKNCIVK